MTTLGRALDLLSTYYITPHLKLETNRLVTKLGWKGSILLQIPLIIFGTFFRPIAVFFLAWSVIIASSNISGAWFVRNMTGGDVTYGELLQESAQKTKLRNLILDEIPPLLLFVVPNSLIWIWVQLEVGDIFYLISQETFMSYILIITGALILHGIMSFLRNFFYVNRLRKRRAGTDPNKPKSA